MTMLSNEKNCDQKRVYNKHLALIPNAVCVRAVHSLMNSSKWSHEPLRNMNVKSDVNHKNRDIVDTAIEAAKP